MRRGNAEALEDLIRRRRRRARPAGRWARRRRKPTPRCVADARPLAVYSDSVSRPAAAARRRRHRAPAGLKSISNRVLLLAGLASGTTVVHDLLDSDDTRVMLAALRRWAAASSATAACCASPAWAASWRCTRQQLFLGNAGTAMRPLAAALAVLAALQGGRFELSGVPRMHERPIGDLVDALRQLGCTVDDLGAPGYPPLRLQRPPAARCWPRRQPIRVRGDVSSQFLTALLLALPLASATRADRRRGRGRADLQALCRDHAGAAGALRHRRAARGLAALHDAARQPLPLAGRDPRRGRCLVGLVLHRAGRHRRHGGAPVRIEGVGQRLDPGRHPLRRGGAGDGRRRSRSGPDWLEVHRGAWPLRGHHAGLQPHPRRRDDAGGDGAVRRRPDHG